MSRFVSGGTIDEPAERDEAWQKAQAEVEARRREKAEKQQDGGKSLYETLQANKAAKQEAFEESIRLRNQFRSLDEDEAEFLDSVLASERAQAAAVRTQTTQQLDAFRKQRDEAERAARAQQQAAPDPAEADGSGAPADATNWTVGPRKRRKGPEGEGKFGGLKIRRTLTAEKSPTDAAQRSPSTQSETESGLAKSGSSVPASQSRLNPKTSTTETSAAAKDAPDDSMAALLPHQQNQPSDSRSGQGSAKPELSPNVGLGLGAYSSDEED